MTKFLLHIILLGGLPLNPGSSLADIQPGKDAYDRGDYETALKEWRPLAEQGLAAAQFFLGVIYENGEGVSQDYGEAMRWYRLAADQGDAMAQYSLGVRYTTGRGVSQNYIQAYMWNALAAAQGLKIAITDQLVLESLMTPDQIAEAQRLVKKSPPQSAYKTAKKSLSSRGLLGPIRHTELSPELIDRIRHLQDVFAEVYPISHQEWLDGFQRDQDPENEVARWEQMASAYTTFLDENDLDAAARKEAFGLLLVRSTTSDVESQLSNLKQLTADQAKRLVALYKAAPRPITIQNADGTVSTITQTD